MTQFAVITEAETIYNEDVGRFFVFIVFTTSEIPSGYNCWFGIDDIPSGAVSNYKLIQLLQATSSKSVENLKQKIVKIQIEDNSMKAFSNPNKEEWVELQI